jgi:hypothetical protein
MKTFLSDISKFFLIVLVTGTLYAQNTSLKLPTTDSLSSLIIKDSNDVALIKLNADGGIYLRGTFDKGTIPVTGNGIRLMWLPFRVAFRAGYTENNRWDIENIGAYSTALGNNPSASGYSSIAMGEYATASGTYSTAVGFCATGSGFASASIGYLSTASGTYSTAMGHMTVASELRSTAMGSFVKANHQGAFIIGDNSTSLYDSSSTNNEMTMRFAGGYRLFTNSDCTHGAYMTSDQNSWSNYCDRNMKENFCPINGEQILNKIKEIPITEWNYKGTNPSVKYIGPVAQDFYSAFHLGGTDSLGINTLCIDGVNIAAIQALEKRTTELKTAVSELQKTNEKIALIEKNNTEMQKKIERLEQLITSADSNNEKLNTAGK